MEFAQTDIMHGVVGDRIVSWSYMFPGDPLSLVLLLLLLEHQLNEELLEFFIAVIYAELLETGECLKINENRDASVLLQ